MSTLSATTRTTRSSPRTRCIVKPHHIPDVLYLPRTVDSWPWREMINPHHAVAKKDSNDWFFSFRPFTPQSRTGFERCDFGEIGEVLFFQLANLCRPPQPVLRLNAPLTFPKVRRRLELDYRLANRVLTTFCSPTPCWLRLDHSHLPHRRVHRPSANERSPGDMRHRPRRAAQSKERASKV